MRENKNLPVKRYIYSKSPDLIKHFFLLILFAFLPFVFSDRLFETETTFRFIVLGLLVSAVSLFFLALYIFSDDLKAPMARNNLFYKILAAYTCFLGLTVFLSFNKGEAIYIYLKLCTIAGCFFLFMILLRNTTGFLALLIKYANVSIFIFTLIRLIRS